MLRAYLFPELEVFWGNESLSPIISRTARGLLAYLLINRERAHPREVLIGTFWPERSEAVGRRRLSQALWQIGAALDPYGVLVTQQDSVQIDPDLDIWMDVEEFKQRYKQCTPGGRVDLTAGERCVALYQGQFLSRHEYDWAILERERLRELFLDVLQHLIAGYKHQGAYARALDHARRWAAENPCLEEAHREVMRLCHLLGQDIDALTQYEICHKALAETLNVEPTPQTVALAREIAHRSDPDRLADLPPTVAPFLTLIEGESYPTELPLVGREAEHRALLLHLEALLRGQGGVLLLEGEPGVGKTRLLQALADDAGWRGLEVLWGAGREVAGAVPYGPLGEALNGGLIAANLEPLSQQMERIWLQVLAPFLPALARSFPDLPPAPALDPAQERTRLVNALAELLRGWSQTSPLLLILEDLHWAGKDSLDLLARLPAALGDSQVLVVGSYRGAEARSKPGVWAQLQALDRAGVQLRLELRSLDDVATGELIRRSLGIAQTAPLFEARLYQETQGNPLFILETLQTLYGEGLLTPDESGSWQTPWDASTIDYAELPLPKAVEETITRRLDNLSPDSLNTLQLGAVLGQDFDFDLLHTASQEQVSALLAALQPLVQHRFLEETEKGYRFNHDTVRQVTYQGIAPEQRIQLHRQTAQALTDLRSDESRILAYHWTQAEVWEPALKYHHQAAERARQAYANAEAIHHYSLALAMLEKLADDPELSFELRLAREEIYHLTGEREAQAQDLQVLSILVRELDEEKRADVLLRQARYAEVTGDFEAAIEAAREMAQLGQSAQDQSLQAEGHLQRGRVLQEQHNYSEARTHFETALALAGEMSLSLLAAESLRGLGEVERMRGNYSESIAYFERALHIYREIGDILGEGKIYTQTGLVHQHQSDYVAAQNHYRRALRIFREVGNREAQGETFNYLGLWAQEKGDLSEAQAYHERALLIYRSIGDRSGESKALNNLGITFGMRSDYLQAREVFEQVLQIDDELGRREKVGNTLHNLGLVCRLLGEFASAKPYYQQALEIERTIGNRLGEAQTLANLGSVSWYLGEYQQALIDYQQSLVICRQIDSLKDVGQSLNGIGKSFDFLGDYAAAQKHFEQALSIGRQLGTKNNQMGSLEDLSLLYHHLGDDHNAQAYAQKALQIAQEIGNRSVQGQALTNLGHALTGLGQLAEANEAYQQALVLRRELGQHYLAIESLAGLARVALVQGQIVTAQAHVKEILDFLESNSLDGTDEPIRIYLTCYRVLQISTDRRAEALLTTAYNLLQERASRIDDQELRHSYLENVPAHRELVAAYAALQSPPQEQRITVSLPSAEAPLGRPLREDEFVKVTWTLRVPEDKQIQGKVAQRRQRLLRLLHEAQEQGAIPRDEDLAAVSGVSLRTISSDLAALRKQGHTVPPRQRKTAE